MCRCTCSTDTESLALADMSIRAVVPRFSGVRRKRPESTSTIHVYWSQDEYETYPQSPHENKFYSVYGCSVAAAV